MARTGDEEGEGQEAQEGSRRLTCAPEVSTFPIRLYLFSQHVPYTSHARNLSFSIPPDWRPPRF
jgi:hypothetical protein